MARRSSMVSRWFLRLGIWTENTQTNLPVLLDVENQTTSFNSQPACNSNPLRRLGKAFIVMAFTVATALLILFHIDTGPFSSIFFIFSLIFASMIFMARILLHKEFPTMSRVLIQLAVVSLVLAFLTVTSAYLTVKLRWGIWMSCALLLISILVRFLNNYVMENGP